MRLDSIPVRGVLPGKVRAQVPAGVSLLVLSAALSASAFAQTLARRPAQPQSAGTSQQAAASDARQALPIAAEGEYRWGEPGEVIELYVEEGALRGYLTRRTERSHADSSPMTFAFASVGTTGTSLTFATQHIHGDWYSFTGQVVRGIAKSPHQEGYYLLQGTLTTHLGPDDSQSATGTPAADEPAVPIEPLTRQVSLKLAAGGLTSPSQ